MKVEEKQEKVLPWKSKEASVSRRRQSVVGDAAKGSGK